MSWVTCLGLNDGAKLWISLKLCFLRPSKDMSWGKMSKIWSGPTKDMSAKIIFEALYFLNSSPIFDMAKKLCKVMMLIIMENELWMKGLQKVAKGVASDPHDWYKCTFAWVGNAAIQYSGTLFASPFYGSTIWSTNLVHIFTVTNLSLSTIFYSALIACRDYLVICCQITTTKC